MMKFHVSLKQREKARKQEERCKQQRAEAEAAYARGERTPAGHLKHIDCDGARFHVLSWGLRNLHNGKAVGFTRCSEPDCEVNFR
jgi:hypothetical protein